MADPTTNYAWDIPDVGGDVGSWGTKLVTLINSIDTVVKSVSDSALSMLSKAGGVMTGRIDAKTATMVSVDKGAISGAQDFDLAAAQYFMFTVAGALSPAFINPPAGGFAYGVVLRITNGGSSVIAWPPAVKWPSASAPVLTAAGVDIVVLLTDDSGVTLRGMLVAKDVR